MPRVGFEPALFLVDQNLVSESLSVQKNLMVFLIFQDELIMAQDSHMYQNDWKNRLGLVADPVIEAIARPEFEDGLRTGVHHGGCWGP